LIAFDTNILIYAEDPDDRGGRHQPAAELLTKLAFAQAIAPVQVLGEFVNVCRKKQLATPELAARKVANYARIFDTPKTEPVDIEDAALLADRFKLQFFDALIVTVALRAGATMLLSEDMQDGLRIEALQVLDPFNPANHAAIAALLV
jgi:predicted nucleic acid-binding protein